MCSFLLASSFSPRRRDLHAKVRAEILIGRAVLYKSTYTPAEKTGKKERETCETEQEQERERGRERCIALSGVTLLCTTLVSTYMLAYCLKNLPSVNALCKRPKIVGFSERHSDVSSSEFYIPLSISHQTEKSRELNK